MCAPELVDTCEQYTDFVFCSFCGFCPMLNFALFSSFQVDLEPQGRLRMQIDLKWAPQGNS